MKKIIKEIQEFQYEDFEIRYYERGQWHLDTRVGDEEEAIERMNQLITKYGYHTDEVSVVKIIPYKNITDENL